MSSNIINIRNKINNYYKQKKEDYWNNRRKRISKRRNDKWNKYYGSKQWYTLRNNYYMLHPICECHEKLGIIVPAEEVHHLKVWSKAVSEEEKWNLLLDSNNLVSLCKSCHHHIHKLIEEKNTDMISLDELVEYEKTCT